MKATEKEVKKLRDLQDQRDGLRKLLGDMQRDETRVWLALNKKYKLNMKHHFYTINFKTREITRKDEHKSLLIKPGNN